MPAAAECDTPAAQRQIHTQSKTETTGWDGQKLQYFTLQYRGVKGELVNVVLLYKVLTQVQVKIIYFIDRSLLNCTLR